MYSIRCGTITSNIKKDGFMIKKMLLGEWSPIDLGSKSADELDPESSLSIKQYLDTRSQQKITQKESNLYTCPKCKNKRTTQPSGKQNRSLDEGQSQWVKCLNDQCGMKFCVG